MKFRKLGVVLSSALLLGTFGLVQNVTTTSATAAPAAAVGSQAQAGVSADRWDFRKGYDRGYRDGRRAARDDCDYPDKFQSYSAYDDDDSDYERGYDKGFSRGFKDGYRQYC